MNTQIFSTFDAFADSIRHVNMRVTCLDRPQTSWWTKHLALNEISIVWGQDGGANSMEGEAERGWVTIFVPRSSPWIIKSNGEELDEQSLVIIPGTDFSFSAPQANQWFAVFVPRDSLQRLSKRTLASILGASSKTIRAGVVQMHRLRSVAERLYTTDEDTPNIFLAPQASEAAARELFDAVFQALEAEILPPPIAPGRHAEPRQSIVRTAIEMMDRLNHVGENVSVEEIAAAADVSERTLRTVFHKYFGVGPRRYLKLRKLNLARKALQNIARADTTVTNVAAGLGFWEFGRFSHDYKMLFGELPSETLRRAESKPLRWKTDSKKAEQIELLRDHFNEDTETSRSPFPVL